MPPGTDPHIILERCDDGSFTAISTSLPGYVARGDTEGAALRKMRRALKLHFKHHERDFSRITRAGGDGDAFRWSRWRAPLFLRLPLSRSAKLSVAAFGAGLTVGAFVFVVRQRRH